VDTNEPPDNGFDLVIDLDVTASSRQNLETVISRLSSEYPKLFGEMPTADELDDATTAALNEYKPDLKHEIGGKPRDKKQKGGAQQQEQNGGSTKAKTPKLEFFAVRLPSARVASVLETVFRDADPETARFYRQLYGSRRLQTEFHVTLMHRASASQHPDKWDKLVEIHKEKFDPNSPQTEPELGTCQVKLERIVWDGRVMCFVVRLLNGGEGSWETVNPIAHVTVGTANKDIKPKESNDLLQRWVKEGSGESGIRDLLVNGNVVLDGSVRGVLQKF
jgi:tRNA ligase